MSLSVCLYVRSHITGSTHTHTHTNFTKFSEHVAGGRASDNVAIRYLVPVL